MIVCSSEDCEKLWFFYKLEGEPKGVSTELFYVQQGVHRNSLSFTCGNDAVIDSSAKIILLDPELVPEH